MNQDTKDMLNIVGVIAGGCAVPLLAVGLVVLLLVWLFKLVIG